VESDSGDEDDESSVEPVYLLVPVVDSDGLVLDVKGFRCRGFVFGDAR
jgi:hypothetical protein